MKCFSPIALSRAAPDVAANIRRRGTLRGNCYCLAEAPGLGDVVAAVATPIARALGLTCIDPATKQLRPDSGCAKRKAALNRLTHQ